MKKIVFTNDKGGVGKTTTVANLAVGLSYRRKKILVVDMDPQADVTYALLGQRAPEAKRGYLPPDIHTLLLGHYSLDQVMLEVPRYKNITLIPSNSDLAAVSMKLSSQPTRLRSILDNLHGKSPDVILIDTGKGLDPLAINALAAANDVIVMVTPGRLELDAISRLQEHIALVRTDVLKHANKPVMRGILLTLADHYSVTEDTIKRIREKFPDLLFNTIIPKNNDLQKAIARSKSIFEVAPKSKGAVAYQQLLDELHL